MRFRRRAVAGDCGRGGGQIEQQKRLRMRKQAQRRRLHGSAQIGSGSDIFVAVGGLAGALAQILEEYGRGEDYIEVSLDSNIRYNPLNNDLDPYAQAFSLASIITSMPTSAAGAAGAREAGSASTPRPTEMICSAASRGVPSIPKIACRSGPAC